MTTLVFRTPGVLDLRALTTFGMPAKPNSTSPIGMFGTGMKYAIAVMVRLGAEPVLWRGTDRHTFFRKPVDFRGADFDLIGVRHERFVTLSNPQEELPFTTQLGATWEAWQAYRELEANTRDEAGETFVVEDGEVFAEPGYTCVCVDHPAMLEAHEKRNEIFLVQDAQVIDERWVANDEWIDDALYHEVLVASKDVPLDERRALLAAVVRAVNDAE